MAISSDWKQARRDVHEQSGLRCLQASLGKGSEAE